MISPSFTPSPSPSPPGSTTGSPSPSAAPAGTQQITLGDGRQVSRSVFTTAHTHTVATMVPLHPGPQRIQLSLRPPVLAELKEQPRDDAENLEGDETEPEEEEEHQAAAEDEDAGEAAAPDSQPVEDEDDDVVELPLPPAAAIRRAPRARPAAANRPRRVHRSPPRLDPLSGGDAVRTVVDGVDVLAPSDPNVLVQFRRRQHQR